MAGPDRGFPNRGRSFPSDRIYRPERVFGKRTCKPNSVVCGHSSRRRVAADAHQRPTRRFRQLLEPPERIGPMRCANLALGPHIPPYLVLLRVGFTLPPALQSERCALTAPFHPYHCVGQPFGRVHQRSRISPKEKLQWRYLLCGTGRPRALKPASRTLSGTLPCGVRTFLPRPAPKRIPAATARSSCHS
jgi:hypothetical protein